MSRPITIQDSKKIIPASFDSDNSVYASANTSYPSSNGLTDSSSGTRGQWNITTGQNAETFIYYNFDINSSLIPDGATILSIVAKAKAYISTTNASRITTRQCQLCTDTGSGIVTKGTAYTISNSTTAFTLTAGDWTLAELRGARIRLYVKRGTSNTSTAYNVRFYGADLTITYEYEGVEYEVHTYSDTTKAEYIDDSTYTSHGDSYTTTFFTSYPWRVSVVDNGVEHVPSYMYEYENLLIDKYNTKSEYYTYSGSIGRARVSEGIIDGNDPYNVVNNHYYDLGCGAVVATSRPNAESTLRFDFAGANFNTNDHFKFEYAYILFQASGGLIEHNDMMNDYNYKLEIYNDYNVTLASYELPNKNFSTRQLFRYDFDLTDPDLPYNIVHGLIANAIVTAPSNPDTDYYFGFSISGIDLIMSYYYDNHMQYTIEDINEDHQVCIINNAKMNVKTGSITFSQAANIYKNVNGIWVRQTEPDEVIDEGVVYVPQTVS